MAERGRGGFLPFMLGWALSGLAGVTLLFAGLAALLQEPFWPFLLAAVASALAGLPLLLSGRIRSEPSRRMALLTVLLLWLVLPLFGALPYLLSGVLSPLDALFESLSGFTTTGATVITDLGSTAGSLLLYRALSQWLGGIGIIIVFTTVFPSLGVAGRQLFQGEEPGPREDRLAPRLRFASAALLSVYASLTVLSFLSWWVAGMAPLDAAAYAFATLSAGGFSTGTDVHGTLALPVFQLIGLLFMMLAGTNFTLQYRAYQGRFRELWLDTEFRTYLLVLVGAGLALFLLPGASDDFSSALFQAVSVITTTGFTTESITDWPPYGQLLLLGLMFVGGCAGSAAGGIRIMRWLIVLRSSGLEVQRMLHPRAALPLRIGHRLVTREVLRATAAFFTLYVLLTASSTFLLSLSGMDLMGALSASLSTVGLVGFGFDGEGQLLDFTSLSATAKGLLMLNMYAGRLEIVTLFVLLAPGFWRLPRRRRRQREVER